MSSWPSRPSIRYGLCSFSSIHAGIRSLGLVRSIRRFRAYITPGGCRAPGGTLEDSAEYPRLKAYVEGVVGAFANDGRVLAWDLWNEPDNGNNSSYWKVDPKNKTELVLALLPQVFAWAREDNPIQPLTSGIWQGRGLSGEAQPDGSNSDRELGRHFLP